MATISSLTAILSYAIALCGIVPLFPWLTTAPRAAIVIGLLAGIWQDRRGAWPLKNWMFNTAIVPVFLWYALQFSRANAIQPVVSVLAIMLAVRLAGEKSVRHYLQIQALALFCLASSSLFDLSPSFLFYLTLLLLLVAVSLVLLTFHVQDSTLTLSRTELRKVVAVGLLLPLVSLPLLVFFFPILPRTQLPLWNFLAAPALRPSGYSDKVEPGSNANVAASRVLAFRAEMPRLPQQQLYWRGTVFNRIEGQRWVRDPAIPAEQLVYRGARTDQTIYPEPGFSRALFGLDAPASVLFPRVRSAPDGTFEQPGISGRRVSYRVESVTSGVLSTSRGINRAFYLRLPATVPQRITQLANEIRRRGVNDARRLELLENHFRTSGYRYSMRDLPTGEHALEQFLFDRKQGHCEFFASSFALLLRGAGVPARLVGGYLGGEYNDLGGYYQISDDMAHVWVEAYIEGRGWLRVDPSGFALNAGEMWGTNKTRTLRMRLRLALDSLDHSWNRTIVTYDFERQVEAARNAGKRLQGLEPGRLLRSLLPVLLLAATLAGAWSFRGRFSRIFASREERLLQRFYSRVERECGITVERGRQGLFEIAAITGNGRVREFATIYAAALYRDRKLTDDEVTHLKRILAEGFSPSGEDSI